MILLMISLSSDFISSLKNGDPAIPIESQIATTLTTFAILESLQTGNAVDIKPDELLT